jgi:hypothetical protein
MQRVKPIVEEPNEKFGYDNFFRVQIGKDVTYRQAHRATAAYYGMIEWMDAQFGRVVEKLKHFRAGSITDPHRLIAGLN